MTHARTPHVARTEGAFARSRPVERRPSARGLLRTTAALVLALALVTTACGPPSYPRAALPRFTSRAPRAVVFEALVRRAGQLGYQPANVDPISGQFAVYARALAHPRRAARRRPPSRRPSRRRLERVDDDLLIVEVGEGHVRVRPFGPHVVGEDRMHPELAVELRTFADALRRTSDALRTGGLSGIVTGPPAPPPPVEATPAPARAAPTAPSGPATALTPP